MANLKTKSGPLGVRLASHLLRRTSFFINRGRIKEFAQKTASEAVDELLKFPALAFPEGPVSYKDGKIIISNYESVNDSVTSKQKEEATINWFLYESMVDRSMRHKLAWFLHTCFVTSQYRSVEAFYHCRLIQYFALGNLRILSEKMTLDNQMLSFLDNKLNTKFQPNENYAREFLELFTILKGEQIGEGNYTTYTEVDVVEAAKVFTGFTEGNEIDPDTGFLQGKVKVDNHDTNDKEFSNAFGNKIIKGRNSEQGMYEELRDFIQMVFDQKDTARAFCRRLYRYFVKPNITEEVEKDIIEKLATELYSNDYELESIVRCLLTSEHFFDVDDENSTDETIGAMIKSPLDLLLGTMNFFDMDKNLPSPTKVDSGEARDYSRVFKYIRLTCRDIKMNPFDPPSVQGYEAYGQAPGYTKFWFDASTIIHRLQMPQKLLGNRYDEIGNIAKFNPFKLNIVQYVKDNIDNPGNADSLIQELTTYLFPEPCSDERKIYLKNLLLNEIPDEDWAVDWQNYLTENDEEYVLVPLTNLIEGILKIPEYQTL